MLKGGLHLGLAPRGAIQTAVAAGLSLFVATAMGLPHPYWSVISAIVVTQSSVGSGVLGVARDRALGTVAGALVGAAVAYVRPEGQWGMAVALMLTTAVLAYFGMGRPWLKVAPVTAAIVIAAASGPDGPAQLAFDRVMEILVGSLIGVAAILMLFPRHAQRTFKKHARDTALKTAELLEQILLGERADHADVAARHADLKRRLDALATSAEHVIDMPGHQGDAQNRQALARAFWRVRSDIVILGRGFQPSAAEGMDAWAKDARRAARRLRSLADGQAARPMGDPPLELGLASVRPDGAEALAHAAAAIGLAHLHRDLDDLAARFVDVRLVNPLKPEREDEPPPEIPAAGANIGAIVQEPATSRS